MGSDNVPVYLTQEEKQEILKNSDKFTAKQLSEQYGCSRSLILKIWMENEYHKPKAFRYYVDNNYFSKIDSANKAYTLGLIASDGNVYKRDGHQGELRIHFKDGDSERNILAHILKDMSSTHPINCYTKNNRSYVDISIVSQQIFDDLCNIGIVPQKTWCLNICQILNHIPSKFYRDFFRGYFDGDGCITNVNERPSGVRVSIACPANIAQDFIDVFHSLGITMSFIKDNRQEKYTNEFGMLSLSGYHKYLFLKYIYYNDCICLERKFKRAFDYCKLIESNATNRSENIDAIIQYDIFLEHMNNTTNVTL